MQVAIVTGAGSGIGLATARHMAGMGMAIVGTSRDPERLKALDEVVPADRLHIIPCDVTDEGSPAEIVNGAIARFGRIDHLVNNAGDCILKPIETLSLDTLWYMLQINLEAAFMGIKHGMPAIGKSGGGAIVNISSVAGIKAGPNSTGYGTSKAGMTNLTKTAAIEGASDKIRVNAVHPGLIWSGHSQVKAFGEEGAKKFDTW